MFINFIQVSLQCMVFILLYLSMHVTSLVILKLQQQRAYSGIRLACLEIRSRDEEASIFTRNRIYSLKGFYFLLYRRRYFLLVSELIQYACQRRPEIRLRSQVIRVYKYTKIHGPRFQRNYIIARDQQEDLQGTSFQSSPKINRMLITRPICIQ